MLFRFIMYGLLGIAVEVIWTALYEKIFEKKKGWDLKGSTYIWMFPIYGTTVFLFEPLHALMDHHAIPWYFRGIIYMNGIFLIEYLFGWLIRKTGKCPWDYSDQTKYHLDGLIRFDYIPVWFVLGLTLEHANDLLLKLTPQVYAIL